MIREYKRRRVVVKNKNIKIFFILIIVGVILFLFLNPGMRSLISSYYKYIILLKKLNRYKEENTKLKQSLSSIENDMNTLEKLARREGMCYTGEKIYRIIKVKKQ